jgi:phosphoglycolate phosphatase
VVQPGPVGFDLDMTLIDSRPAILAAFEALSADVGTRLDLGEIDGRLGLKLEDELRHWFPEREVPRAAATFRRHYVALAARSTEVLPGAREALAAVTASGRRTVIITAKHEVSVAPSLAATGLQADEVFTFVHGEEKAEVLRRIGAALYVGDTPADMEAAASAGVAAVGVTSGSFGTAALTSAGAAAVLASLEAFPDWYGPEVARSGA